MIHFQIPPEVNALVWQLSVPIEDCTEAPIEITHSGLLLSACR
jgi:hypothetical protein